MAAALNPTMLKFNVQDIPPFLSRSFYTTSNDPKLTVFKQMISNIIKITNIFKSELYP
jgi:hypothetical protein